MRKLLYGYVESFSERIKCYIIIEEIFQGDDMLCENYGLELVGRNGRNEVRNITVNSGRINRTAALVCAPGTTPEELSRVVENIVSTW